MGQKNRKNGENGEKIGEFWMKIEEKLGMWEKMGKLGKF